MIKVRRHLNFTAFADNNWSSELGKSASSTGDNWITISNQTTGGEFALHTEQTDSSLPVTLSEFKAEIHEQEVEIIWSTDSEIENLGFILERRTVGEVSHTSRASVSDPRETDPECLPVADPAGGGEPDKGDAATNTEGDSDGWFQLASYQTHSELEGAGSSNTRSMYTYTDDSIEPGVTYEYRLADVSYTGEIVYHMMTLTGVMIEKLPETYALSQNYPNPFNPETTIRYSLPEQSDVSLIVFDITGREVVTLKSGSQTAGYHEIRWNGLDHSGNQVATGLYYCLMQTPQHRQTIKMMLLR